jgi:hypothetical protein
MFQYGNKYFTSAENHVIFPYGNIYGAPERIRYELRLPWTPRLLVFSGFLILVIAAVLVVIRAVRLPRLRP